MNICKEHISKEVLIFRDKEWRYLECSRCDFPKRRKTLKYLPEIVPSSLGKYWQFHTICKKCQIKNVIYLTEKQMLERFENE